MTENNSTPDTPTEISPVAMSTDSVDAGLQFSGGDFPDNDHAESSLDENPAPLGKNADGSEDDPDKDPHRDNDPVDDGRTTRAHAGEAIQDTRNWPGYLLLLLGLAALGGTLTAVADGFEGWTAILGVISVVCFAAGLTFILIVRKRVKARRGLNLMDQVGH